LAEECPGEEWEAREAMNEDDLPEEMEPYDYAWWFDRSAIVDGVRMGPVWIKSELKMKIQHYCKCGAYWYGEVTPEGAATIEEYWQKNHSGEGHEPCDARTAARARTKSEHEIIME